jgi:FkbM family methyltransferase
VDIGANRGQFALIVRFLYPEASIISFEPLAGVAGLFRHVFSEDHKVRLEKCAIGATSQRHVIHVSARDDSSSLLPIGEGQLRNFPGTQEVGSEVVDVRRLDEVLRPEEISPPALLKLDVQGFELEALRGCEGLLRCFSWVYCECSFVPLYEGQAMADQIVAWLHRRNFRLRGVHNMTHEKTGGSLQADFLFERQ